MPDIIDEAAHYFHASQTFGKDNLFDFHTSDKVSEFTHELVFKIRKSPRLKEIIEGLRTGTDLTGYKEEVTQMFGDEFYVKLLTFLVYSKHLLDKAMLMQYTSQDGQTRIGLKED
jgi:hypothetical protein